MVRIDKSLKPAALLGFSLGVIVMVATLARVVAVLLVFTGRVLAADVLLQTGILRRNRSLESDGFVAPLAAPDLIRRCGSQPPHLNPHRAQQGKKPIAQHGGAVCPPVNLWEAVTLQPAL